VNGALTIGENIGDLGGVGIAWKAYQVSLHGEEAPVIDGLTGGQRFFMSWARTWQQKIRDEEAIRLLTIDPHAPGEFRCNQIVRNLDEFYARLTSSLPTSCGSNLQLGSVSGSRGHIATQPVGGRDQRHHRPTESPRPARPAQVTAAVSCPLPNTEADQVRSPRRATPSALSKRPAPKPQASRSGGTIRVL
jgi:hypothetical protein